MPSFANHYANLHTEELIEISRKELVDEARAALNAELAGRGISDAQAIKMHAAIAAESWHSNLLASRRDRLLAFKIDLLGVPLGLALVLSPLALVSASAHSNTVLLSWILYFLVRDGIPGESVGKRLLKLKVVRRDTDQSCSWLRSIARNLTFILLPIDLVPMLSDQKLRLGDRLANTMVIKASVTK